MNATLTAAATTAVFEPFAPGPDRATFAHGPPDRFDPLFAPAPSVAEPPAPSPQPLAQWETAELVTAAQEGDRDAFGELAVRFEGMVRAVALRRLGNESEAVELAQEALIRAMDRLHQLAEPRAFGAWLKSITVRMAINRQVRRRRAIDTEPATLEATCIDDREPVDAALTAERATIVRDGLGRLGAMDRDTLVAFYVRGQSLVEMSDAFGAPIGTIKRRLHVARKRLAAELSAIEIA
ncbi:MAG: sigma-70 family RNA polymerase sigma factor [Planctomycetota bacterium]